MAVTAQDIIYKSLRLLGVLASGEAPTAAEAQDSLYSLNSLIDSFASNPQFYFYTADDVFTLSTSSTSYTIGVGATFDTTRPIRIVGAFVRNNSTSVDTPVGIITEQYWNNISDKVSASAGLPTKILYRPTMTSTSGSGTGDCGTIVLYPRPSTAYTLHIRSEKMIRKYTDLTDTQPLPPGYQRLLELSLAVELAPEYGSKAAPETLAYLKTSLEALVRTNLGKIASSKIGSIPNSNVYTDTTIAGSQALNMQGG